MSGLEQDKEHAFDAFCKRVIKNEFINAMLEIQRLSQREVTFSALTQEEEQQLQYIDLYSPDQSAFAVQGAEVSVSDGALVRALRALSGQRRDIILLAYLLDQTDAEIAERLGLNRSTVQYRRTSTLAQLRKMMEVTDLEKSE